MCFQRLANGGDNIFLSRQPPRAGHAAREVAFAGVHNFYAARA